MSQDLTKAVALHDDSTSAVHEKHKREKAQRLATHYEPVPAIERQVGGGILDGVFKSPTKGYSFRMRSGSAVRAADSEAYTREVLAMSKERSRFTRVRIRDGKERRETGHYKHGAVSLVSTLPPWAVRTVARIGPSELEHLMLYLAEAQAKEIKAVSGRDMYGGGIHLDTGIPHFHNHVPKSSAKGELRPRLARSDERADAGDHEHEAHGAEEELAVGGEAGIGEDFLDSHAEAAEQTEKGNHCSAVHGVFSQAFLGAKKTEHQHEQTEACRNEGGRAAGLRKEERSGGPKDEDDSGKDGGANGRSHGIGGESSG